MKIFQTKIHAASYTGFVLLTSTLTAFALWGCTDDFASDGSEDDAGVTTDPSDTGMETDTDTETDTTDEVSDDEVGTPFCGDNVIDPGEECDGIALNGATCDSLGFPSGHMYCSDECEYEVGGCGSCGGPTFLTTLNETTYWLVKNPVLMTDTNIDHACGLCGLEVPCGGPEGCWINDSECIQTENESACGYPLKGLAASLCGDSDPSHCPELYGAFQHLGHTAPGDGACGIFEDQWCIPGSLIESEFALCITPTG